ncbi:DUF885 domain-containing protein [Caulobacter segnis]|uniref:DUF885 domain-containing protein n=1 Tax=Caulobacter segnis TaxID=88688 RepID=UPI00240EF442|nr:DUF885 domain-containing protein [Caulobacter segnis]MDG2523118.1 DUF885 domain-containing protein [Caulobacter segnis]
MSLRLSAAFAVLAFASSAAAQTPAQKVDAVADRFVAESLNYNPSAAYSTGLKAPTHARFYDNSEAGIRAFEAKLDAIEADARAIDAKALDHQQAITLAVLIDSLESDRGTRVCKSHLWNLNHMFGWQSYLVRTTSEQPVGDADLRGQALQRAGSIPKFVATETANLRKGLSEGYAAPKPVVVRVIKQIDGMIVADPLKSPFYSPASRDKDAAFGAALAKVITDEINPALKQYRDFLQAEYMPKARDTLGLSALPNGAACYQAQLRGYTTLDRTPKQVFDLGAATVAANAEVVKGLGQKLYGTQDLKLIAQRNTEAPANKVASEEELIAYTRQIVDSSRVASAALVTKLPEQDMVVKPFEPFMRGSGVSSHYEMSADPKKPGTYRIASEKWASETKGGAEITAVHEGWPGHHLQIAMALGVKRHDLFKVAFNSAYVEGWARYSEALSEEVGIYTSDFPKISRRMWPARGMVLDPGIHMFGWTREQAAAYAQESGRFMGEEADDLVDRIAVLPGQLTAYDSGGLEIFALRRQAEEALGPKFDLKAFHDAVLRNGVVPLKVLRSEVEAWIAAEKSRS